MPDILPFQPRTPARRVLLASPAGQTRDKLAADIALGGYEVEICGDLIAAADCLSQSEFDVCLVDLEALDGEAAAFCESAPQWKQPATLMGLSSAGRLTERGFDTDGHFELIPTPCPAQRLLGRLNEAVRRQKQRHDVAQFRSNSTRRLHDEFVGVSDASERLRSEMLAAANEDAPLLVAGPRGSGTSLVARTVHFYSERSEGPLITVDCSLQTAASLEEELLGTKFGDAAVRGGRVRQAAGGTLVLEHVETVSLPLQKKLAELIAEQSSPDVRPSESARVIVVTCADAAQQVEQGQFDAGLHALVCGRTIAVPPLAERPGDVMPLAEHMLHRLSAEEGLPRRQLSFDARQWLTRYEWPGNVAQLRNVIYRAASIDSTGTLTAESITPWLEKELPGIAGTPRGMTLREMERKLIETTFNRFRGNREQTAQALKIGLRTLSGKLRDYGYPPRGGPGSNAMPVQRKAA